MFKKTILLGTSALLTAALATPAMAQIEDEIIVTATKRQTTLQETPVAVTVTTADVIEKAQIFDIKDLQSVVPSLRVSQLQNSANTSFSIRGFGNGGNNIGIEPAVGVFIDGVYRSRAAASIGDLPKLERIEVLSGPQSTLFGKNASAGVISIVTAKPQFETTGYIEGGLGNYNEKHVKGYITGGVAETVAISLGGGYTLRDGYGTVANTGHDINDLNRFNLRGQALWEAGENTTLRLIADMNTIDENCCLTTQALQGPTAAAIGSLGGRLPSPTDQFSYETYSNRDNPNEIDDKGISLQIDHDFGNMTLTSLTAKRSNNAEYHSDSDFTSADLLADVFQAVDIDTFSQELRLTSTAGDNLDWMVGGYYFDESIAQNSGLDYGSQLRSYMDLLIGNQAVLGAIEFYSGNAPGSFFSGTTQTREKFDHDDKSISFFGNVDYHVSDQLTASLGINHTKDEKNVSGSTVNGDLFSQLDLATTPGTLVLAYGAIQGAFGNPNDPIYQAFSALVSPNIGGAQLTAATVGALGGINGAALAPFVGAIRGNVVSGLQPLQFQPQFVSFPNSVEDGTTEDTATTWTARLAYELNDNYNVYASAATGFKPTSWNLTRDSRPFASDATALTAAGLTQVNQNYGTRHAAAEEATVFEIGVKARFDNLAFNVALFDQSIKNFQSTIFQGTGFVLANAGEQSTKGIEFDAAYSPVDALRLTIAGTLLDPIYDSFTGAPGPGGTVVDRSGEKPAGIPTVALSTSATYSHDFDNGMSGFLRGDYQYENATQITDVYPGRDREVGTFNASMGLDLNNGLTAQLWGKNILNDEYFNAQFPGVIQAGSINAYPNTPATYGVNLRKSF